MSMRIYGYTIEPGQSQLISVTGRFIRGITGRARYEIQLDEGASTPFETGIAYESPQPFSSVRITNTHDETQLIEVAIAPGYVDDNRMVASLSVSGGLDVSGSTIKEIENPVDVSGSVVEVSGGVRTYARGALRITTKQSQVGNVPVEIVVYRGDRRSVLLESDRPFWVGGSGISETTGFPVNGSIELKTRAAIWVVAESDITVNVLEEFG